MTQERYLHLLISTFLLQTPNLDKSDCRHPIDLKAQPQANKKTPVIDTMTFLTETLIEYILKHRPVLLLNKSRHALSLVDDLVHRHPSLVTSKGGKAFPLEVWDMVIAFGLEEPREDEYVLVRPRSALRDGALIVDAYDLTSIPAFERNGHYSKLLNADARFLDCLEWGSLSGGKDIEEIIRKGATFAVDLEGIRNHRKTYEDILSVFIELPDLISRLEYGLCGFCGGDGELVAGEPGCWAMGRYGIILESTASVPCPECVGDSYTRDALQLAQEEMAVRYNVEWTDDVEWTDELDEAYEGRWERLAKSVEGRLQELGYLD